MKKKNLLHKKKTVPYSRIILPIFQIQYKKRKICTIKSKSILRSVAKPTCQVIKFGQFEGNYPDHKIYFYYFYYCRFQPRTFFQFIYLIILSPLFNGTHLMAAVWQCTTPIFFLLLNVFIIKCNRENKYKTVRCKWHFVKRLYHTIQYILLFLFIYYSAGY